MTVKINEILFPTISTSVASFFLVFFFLGSWGVINGCLKSLPRTQQGTAGNPKCRGGGIAERKMFRWDAQNKRPDFRSSPDPFWLLGDFLRLSWWPFVFFVFRLADILNDSVKNQKEPALERGDCSHEESAILQFSQRNESWLCQDCINSAGFVLMRTQLHHFLRL